MALVGVLVALLVGGVWLLRRQKPIAGDRAIVAGAIIAGIVGSVGTTFYFWKTTGQSEDRAWWPVGAAVCSLMWLCVVMIVTLVVRLLIARGVGPRWPKWLGWAVAIYLGVGLVNGYFAVTPEVPFGVEWVRQMAWYALCGPATALVLLIFVRHPI